MKLLTRLFIVIAFAFPLMITRGVEAQTGIAWNSQFFNNPDLAGTPVYTRQDPGISFDWGTNSPVPGVVDADNFSARFSTTLYLQAGIYEFTALADDDVRLYVDGDLLIDSFDRHLHGQTLSANVSLTTGNHAVQVDYREAVQQAFLYVDWSFSSSGGDTIPDGNLWYAQYFGNQNLAGTPLYTATEPSPTHSWSDRAPFATIPRDNWSARWTNSRSLNGGTYQISVEADDGVRVYVDNVLYINEWHTASAQSYFTTFDLNPGRHTFMIEFYENEGTAHLTYTLENVTAPTQPPTVNRSAEVTVYALRVRDQPSTITGDTLFQIQRGQVYPVVGRSSDGNWWQINVNGTLGWVYGRYVDVTNATDLPGTTPPPSSVTADITASRLNMRASPEVTNNILTVLTRDTTVEVIGRSAAGFWLRIRVNGINGWISSRYADLESGVSLSQLPVVS